MSSSRPTDDRIFAVVAARCLSADRVQAMYAKFEAEIDTLSQRF